MKKIIALILSFVIAFTVGIPAFAADEEVVPPDITQEEVTDPSAPEDGEADTDSPVIEDNEPLTDEQIEELRKEEALAAFDEVSGFATETFLGLVMLPFVPVMLIVPVFGWVTSAAALMSPISLIILPFRFFAACIEAIDIYVNFDASEYQAIA